MSNTENNQRRIKRMDTWISHVETASGDDDTHLRFLFYWIAYEAAYQNETGKPERSRKRLHEKLARHDRGRLQSILRDQRDNVVRILELRQAHPSFWRKGSRVNKVNKGVTTPEEWESAFRKQVRLEREHLATAVRSGVKISATLDNLFRNLNLVRNQIVHGASAGPASRGLTQVILGAWLLQAFIPCFRDAIKANVHEDWGKLSFPRVGSGPDDECAPPWLATTGRRRR